MKLQGKVAVITGGGTGIGAAVARRFIAEGAKVVITGRRLEPLEAVAKATGAVAFAADSADAAQMQKLAGFARSEFGGIDCLVVNAGVHIFGKISETSDEDWNLCLRGNLNTAMVSMREVLPALIQSRGTIVAVSSIAGLFAGPEATGYVATKHALLGLVRSVARDYGPQGVRVNAVCPGWVRTPMADEEMEVLRQRHGLSTIEDAYKMATKHVPLRRPATPEEVASVIAFLASEDAAMVNGVSLPVDGGSAIVDLPTIDFSD